MICKLLSDIFSATKIVGFILTMWYVNKILGYNSFYAFATFYINYVICKLIFKSTV